MSFAVGLTKIICLVLLIAKVSTHSNVSTLRDSASTEVGSIFYLYIHIINYNILFYFYFIIFCNWLGIFCYFSLSQFEKWKLKIGFKQNRHCVAVPAMPAPHNTPPILYNCCCYILNWWLCCSVGMFTIPPSQTSVTLWRRRPTATSMRGLLTTFRRLSVVSLLPSLLALSYL